ncbi:MAG: hypothetical protein Q8K00_10945 [Syntrophales bacterium]|nr:hypothetical protein [Syntrophales bacterium]
MKNEWQLQKINFSELTLGPDFQVYWFDYEGYKTSLLREIEKNRFMEFGNLWKQSSSEEERIRLIERISYVVDQKNNAFQIYELLSLLSCLYSIKFQKVIGYNHKRIVQLLHQYFDKDIAKDSHFGEYIFKAIRVYARDQIKREDKTGKLFSKAVAYKKRQFELCHKYDHLLKNLFPELWESS